MGKLHSALPAAGTKDKRIVYIWPEVMQDCSPYWKGNSPKSKKCNFLRPSSSKANWDTFLMHVFAHAWCSTTFIHHLSASTCAIVLHFKGQYIPPAAVSWHRYRGGHHLHTGTKTGRAARGKVKHCTTVSHTICAESHQQQHSYRAAQQYPHTKVFWAFCII